MPSELRPDAETGGGGKQQKRRPRTSLFFSFPRPASLAKSIRSLIRISCCKTKKRIAKKKQNPFQHCNQVHKAVVTETAKETRRADGSALVFQRNACVLLNAKLQPLGSRVLGFATHELRARGLMKVLSLAARVI